MHNHLLFIKNQSVDGRGTYSDWDCDPNIIDCDIGVPSGSSNGPLISVSTSTVVGAYTHFTDAAQ